jgi:hypothetical protein
MLHAMTAETKNKAQSSGTRDTLAAAPTWDTEFAFPDRSWSASLNAAIGQTPAQRRSERLRTLQRTIGNQAVLRMLESNSGGRPSDRLAQGRSANMFAWHRAGPGDPVANLEESLASSADLSGDGEPLLGQQVRFPAISDITKSPSVEAERSKDWVDGLNDLKERGAWIVWQGSSTYAIIRWPVGDNDGVSPGPYPDENSLSFCVAHYHQHMPLTPDKESDRADYLVGPSQADVDNANKYDSPGVVRDFNTIERKSNEVTNYNYGPAKRTRGYR